MWTFIIYIILAPASSHLHSDLLLLVQWLLEVYQRRADKLMATFGKTSLKEVDITVSVSLSSGWISSLDHAFLSDFSKHLWANQKWDL